MTPPEMSKITDIKLCTIYSRIKRGWTEKQIISTPSVISPEERFWSKVLKHPPVDIDLSRYTNEQLDAMTPAEKGCWEWTACKKGSKWGDYGCFKDRKFSTSFAHRIAYEIMIGHIPIGNTLDHLCRNHQCCNPKHLEPVIKTVNTLRGLGHTAVNKRKTHCKRGHELTEENVWRSPKHPRQRTCRTCMKACNVIKNKNRTKEKRLEYRQNERNKKMNGPRNPGRSTRLGAGSTARE
jgi:hypothetical protein